MRKVLSFVLVLAMLLGSVSMAFATDFTDVNAIADKEAATVLDALKVIQGYEDGSFKADKILTRAEAAAIISRMLLGADKAAKLTATKAPFKDVAADYWAAGYIEYCVSEGIISGYTNGKFGPTDTLTVPQFAKMLLCALGYKGSEFNASTFNADVSKFALSAGLLAGLDTFSGPCSRGTAATLALNTLQANLVEYVGGNVTVNAGSASVTVGGYRQFVENPANPATQKIEQDEYMQFAEKYFKKLSLNETAHNTYGRPVDYYWVLNNKTIYSASDDSDLVKTYVGKVTKETLYNDLGSTVAKKYDYVSYLNGTTAAVRASASAIAVKSSTAAIDGNVGAGVVTEVYVNDTTKLVTIVEINTFLAQANTDYNANTEKVSITVKLTNSAITTDLTLDDFDIEDIKAKDYLLVTFNGGYAAANIETVEPAKTVEATITGYTSGTSIKLDGTTYSFSKAINSTYEKTGFAVNTGITLVLDNNDAVLATVDAQLDSQYVYIAEIAHVGALSASSYKAAAYFLDGTYEEITVKKVGTGNPAGTEKAGWYTFKTDANGKYILSAQPASFASGAAVTNKAISVTNKAVGFEISGAAFKANSATKFIVVDKNDNINVYTGYAAVPTISLAVGTTASAAVVDGTTYAKYVFIDVNEGSIKGVSSSDYFYVYDPTYTVNVDASGNTYFTYKVLLNGEKTTIDTSAEFDADSLYRNITKDTNGYISAADKVQTAGSAADGYTKQGPLTSKTPVYADGVIVVDGQAYALADGYAIYCADTATDSITTYNTIQLNALTFTGTVYALYNADKLVTTFIVAK